MSKHFGGGRRLEEKVYPSRRGVEDKRPSVFDRLGVREYDDNVPSSHSHPHYGGSDRGGYRRVDGPSGLRKHSPSPMQNPMMTGRRNPETRDGLRSRSRSRSFSPRSRKLPSEVSHHSHNIGGHHGPMKKLKPKEISPHDHRMRQRSNSPLRRKIDKPMGSSNRSPNWRENNSPLPRHKISGGAVDRVKSKKGTGKRSGKKGKQGTGKGRSSSGSSASSGETSSSSRSASSSSSSSEGSSSSTSNASSSSDSSVPSIKLKHDKQKRKKVKRASSKCESVSTGQIQSRISSGSSIESGNIRDNRDLREKIKAKNRKNYEKLHEGTPTDLRQQRRPPAPEQYGGSRNYKPDIREHTPGDVRRRRSSGAGSYDDAPLKRRRMLSPEEYVPSPRRAPPPNDAPSLHPIRRERSPATRDRMRPLQSPMRRAPLEDRRNDMSKRLDNYGEKHRDADRFRDEGAFGRDMVRQKERMAPARPPPLRQHPGPGGLQSTDRDRDRGILNAPPGNNHRFEPRHSRPLLQLPPGAVPSDPKPPYRGNTEDRVLRTSLHSQSPAPETSKHSPMIVKSKEALIEKYRGMKQSQYVDMWVDKTVEACAAPPGSIVSPPKDITPSKFEEPVEPAAKPALAAIGELLSDFSDDDDDAELLNDAGDDPKSEKSEKTNTPLDKDKVGGDIEAEVASSATTETNTQAEKKGTPLQTPVTPVLSQDRKSLGTPQRSFMELREGQSLSRSQTEDDILDRMDFEAISDEEFGDVAGENKIPIVDALGVDWASLVCGEKNRATSPTSALAVSASSMMKVRKRWTSLQVIGKVGLISNCSERLVQNVVQLKMKEENADSAPAEEDTSELEEKLQDELLNAGKFRKMRARGNVIDTIGLGPNSRALSSRRDMALRRYYLGMPQKSLISMDMLHQNASTSSVQDLDSIGELYRLSLSLFKGSDSATVVV